MFGYLKTFLLVLISGVLAAQAAAAAREPNGYPIADVNLRAGPGTKYPVLVTVPTDAPITILGCLEDYTWCDTTFEESRGWMRSIYLAGYYDDEYYLLSDYAPELGYQTVTFDRVAYWDSYYRDKPFYKDRHRVAEPRDASWVDDGVFYDRLSPYGSWTWMEGQYVWVPTGIDISWRPYTRGRWVYTDYGWTWWSNEPFGWATYHYGRWGFSYRIGWFWVPGNRWGPAWVSWRRSDHYLAWAPLPPSYDRGLSNNISVGNIPGYYWSVVRSRYFLSDELPRYYVRNSKRWRRAFERTRPIGHTTIINRKVINNVVSVNYVERLTNKRVVERKVSRTRDWDRAGNIQGNSFEVYRPGLQEGRGQSAPDKPKKIDELARASKTRHLARGEATTEHLLVPPKVRDVTNKRKRGSYDGERSAAVEPSGDDIRRPKFNRRWPTGKDAKRPPPAVNKARARTVPAHDLGRPQAGSRGKTKPKDQKIPVAKKSPQRREGMPNGQKRPAQAKRKPEVKKVREKPKATAEPKQLPTPKKQKKRVSGKQDEKKNKNQNR